MQTRSPIVSGQFYNEEKDALYGQVKDCFLNKEFGPGFLPSKRKDRSIIGVISPHAGYQFSGYCAAHSFKEIGESKLPDIYIMLGLSHYGFSTSLSDMNWETPFGIVKAHREFINLLKDNIKIDNAAHSQEHSIEAEIPFLQFVNKDVSSRVKIASIIVSHDVKYTEIAANIKKAIAVLKLKVCIIASSDFTHYGQNYGYFPFVKGIREKMYNMDKKAIDYIERLQAGKFLKYIEETGSTICGYYPIATMIELSTLLGASKGRLLKYYTSGDIINDYTSAVGYASIVFEAEHSTGVSPVV